SSGAVYRCFVFVFQAEDGIRGFHVTGVQTCALPISDLLADYEPIAQQKGLTLSSHIHHIDYSLEGDAEKIQQILSILLSNAIKRSEERRVGKESRSRGERCHDEKKQGDDEETRRQQR